MATPARFKDIDLDITHYDTDELLAMLRLTDPTEDDIIGATTRMINRATADRLPQVAAFFQDAQDALLDELNTASQQEDQEQDPDQEQEQGPEQAEEQEQGPSVAMKQ